MRSVRLFLALLSGVFIHTSLVAQNCKNEWGVLCTPTIFTQQNQVSFINDLNKGRTTVEDYLDDTTAQPWLVFSDRWHNKLKNTVRGRNNGDELEFMQQCLVKEVSGNWLWLCDFKEPKIPIGWIESKYLLLSKFSLKTDDVISVPKKAMILTSLDALKSKSVILDKVNEQKHFYKHPQVSEKAIRRNYDPTEFKIYFVYKETRSSVFLGLNDQLNGNVITVKTDIIGWIPKANITSWNTRVCLEPSRSNDAISTHGEEWLYGFKNLIDLEFCLDNTCSEEMAIVQFQVGDIPANQMRMPILNNVDENIKEIVSIASKKEYLQYDDTEGSPTTLEYKEIIEILKKKAENTNIIFVIDATTSMRFVYPKVAESVKEIIENNERFSAKKLKFGLITYKDYCDPQPYKIVKLTTNHERITDAILEEQCKSAPCDRTFAEGQYNALINGIKQFNLDPEQSNVIVLIGDCGNHEVYDKSIPLNMQYDSLDVVKTLFDNKLNIISYQVDLCDDQGDSYYKYNYDSQDFITETAKLIAKDSPTLKPKLNFIGDNTYKLDLKEEGRIDFNNMFGRFTFASNKPMNQSHLKESIVSSVKEYLETIDDNIIALEKKYCRDCPITQPPPEGLITYMRDVLNCTRDEAIDFLTRNEITTKANVVIEYSEGVKALVPVVFLSSSEKVKLDKSLRSMFVTDNLTKAEKKMMFQKNIISVAQNILGEGVSEETIKQYSMNELWNVILGIDYADKRVSGLKLDELTDLTKDFKLVFEDFTNKAKEYLETDYRLGDKYKKRSFLLNGEEFFWIPLEDLPGSKTL